MSSSGDFESAYVQTDLPGPASKILRKLAQDHDAAVAFAAPNTIATLERALLEHLQDSQIHRDLNRRREIIAMLAKILEHDPLSPRHHVAQHDAFQYADARLTG